MDLIKEIKGPFPPGHTCPCLSLQAQDKSRVTPGQGQRWDSGGDMEEPPWSVVAYSQARPVPLMKPWLLRYVRRLDKEDRAPAPFCIEANGAGNLLCSPSSSLAPSPPSPTL